MLSARTDMHTNPEYEATMIADRISDDKASRVSAQPAQASPSTNSTHQVRATVLRYSLAVALVLAGHLMTHVLWPVIHSSPYTVYLAVVVISALFGGRGPGILATVLASLDIDYNYMPPYGSFVVDFDNFLYLITFFTVALITSSLQGYRLRAEASLRAAHEELEARVVQRTAELVRSREQFSLLVNGFNDQAFFMIDRHGNVASWNAGAERLLGFKENEIVGRHFTCVWPDGAHIKSTFNTPAAPVPDDRYEYQDWIVRKDGAKFWGYIFVTQVDNSAGGLPGYAMAIRDVTEHKSLERDILDISERERQRIGHDLHDGLGQELTGVAMLSTALAERLETAGASTSQDAEKIADLIHESIEHTRDLARGLCPLDLEDEGLPAALRRLTDRLAQVPRLRCEFDSPHHIRMDATVGSHLYRIAQEAITNAVRHGKASSLTVRLSEAAGRITLVVIDDGIGISDVSRSTGMGLRLMSYRAKMIRGTLDITRGPAGGTIVSCTVDPTEGVTHD